MERGEKKWDVEVGMWGRGRRGHREPGKRGMGICDKLNNNKPIQKAGI